MTRSKLVTATRILLGLLFAASGANHLFWFVPLPPMDAVTDHFLAGLRQTGYFFPLLGAVELAGGLLLVANRLVPLALLALAPVAANVAAFHLALAPAGLPVAGFVLAAGVFLAIRHRQAFTPLLQPRGPAATSTRALELALGLVFLASGAAGLLGKMPPPSTPGAAMMMAGLQGSGYFIPLLAAAQLAAGGLLMAGRPLGLALVVPLMIQILAYRLWVGTPVMLAVSLAMAATTLTLIQAYRDWLRPLLGALPARRREGALQVAP